MKILNFTEKMVLPALLKYFETGGKEGKDQTIRLAWKLGKPDDLMKGRYTASMKVELTEEGKKLFFEGKKGNGIFIEKPPRFKVGEEVKLMWNQRSKYQWFCRECGVEAKWQDGSKVTGHLGCLTGEGGRKEEIPFNKTLGVVEISEVFKIQMGKDHAHTAVGGHEGYDSFYLMPGYKEYDKNIKDLAKSDGFSSAKDMFSCFNKRYNLEIAKPFWVYRWGEK